MKTFISHDMQLRRGIFTVRIYARSTVLDSPLFFLMRRLTILPLFRSRFDMDTPIYVNLVRDPVERVISWYYYVRAPWYFVERKRAFPELPLPNPNWLRKVSSGFGWERKKNTVFFHYHICCQSYISFTLTLLFLLRPRLWNSHLNFLKTLIFIAKKKMCLFQALCFSYYYTLLMI